MREGGLDIWIPVIIKFGDLSFALNFFKNY